MQRASLYTLQGTMFLVMMAAISDASTAQPVATAAAVIIAVINLALIATFLALMVRELLRLLRAQLGADSLTWKVGERRGSVAGGGLWAA
jgi:hypothetical protein